MAIEKIISLPFLTGNYAVRRLIPSASLLLCLLSIFFVFVIAPNEQVMGAVQRIFYFHVGAAMSSYLMIGLLFLSSLFYLVSGKKEWGLLGRGSAKIGFVLCSIVLASGMIWGHSAWNTWWRWEPRLVSFLILWLLLLSSFLLHAFAKHHEREAQYSAVLGILIAINVPIVVFSIKFLDHTQQLHPEVVANQGLVDIRFVYGLLLSTVSLMIFSLWLLTIELTGLLLEKKIENIQQMTVRRSA